MGLARTQESTKNGCAYSVGRSETQTLPAIPLRGVCGECKEKFVSLSQNNCGPQGRPLHGPPNYFSNLHQSSPVPALPFVQA